MQNCYEAKPALGIESILSRLKKVRKSGKGWVACCPSHEDREPSLSVGIGDNGGILLKCWAGCSFQDIVRALGLEPGDLSPTLPRPRTFEERQAAAEAARRREEKIAIESWALRAYRKLTKLRKIYDQATLKPQECDSKLYTHLLFIDYILDNLLLGGIDEKLSCMRAARAGKLGLAGLVIVN